MRTFKTILFLALFTVLTSSAQAASRVEYIVDISGSMNALIGGEKRIDAARKAIASMVQGIPDGSIVALRLYSHRLPPADKAASCKDTELVVPFGPINKQQIVSLVNGAQPLGQTPIAYSLEQAAKDFVLGADEQQTIILVSDGEESCGGDPVAVARALIAQGFKLKINVIGLDVDAAAKNQLAAIATTTGGQYFDAKDAGSLTSSLQKLTQDSLVIQKAGSSIYGEEIRGGDNYETAVPLPTGKLFRLNHHQKRNQYDYFYVEAKPGQKLVASVETGEKSVNIKPDNTFEEGLNPYAGISMHSPQKTEIAKKELIGARNDAGQIVFSVPSGGQGRYYVLVGSGYEDQHKDHRFKLDVVGQFDAGTQQDAGETRDTAIPIPAGTHKGFLNLNDQIDTYRVQLPAGPLNIRMRPSSEKVRVRLELYDADGVEVVNNSAPNEGAVAKIENQNLVKPGEYILKAQSVYSQPPETEYTLEILPAGMAPVAAATGATPAPVPLAPPTAPVVAPTVPVAVPPTVVTTPTTPTLVTTTTQGKVDSSSICENFKRLPFLQKAKVLAIWSGIPLVGGWFIGLIMGYIWGRKSGKRWTAKQAAKQAPK